MNKKANTLDSFSMFACLFSFTLTFFLKWLSVVLRTDFAVYYYIQAYMEYFRKSYYLH